MKLLLEMTPEERAEYWKREAGNMEKLAASQKASADAYMWQIVDLNAELKALQSKYDLLAKGNLDKSTKNYTK